MQHQQLAEVLHKSIIGKFEKWKLYLPFKDNIWSADLVDMLFISKYNKKFVFDYVLLMFIVNINGLFLWKIKKVLKLLMLFKNFR